MPKQAKQIKQKIEVNEELNVSIGALLKCGEAALNDESVSSSAEIAEPEHLGDKDKNSLSTEKCEKLSASAQDSDIKKLVPKFGKISLRHQRAGRGGRTVTLVSISGGIDLGQNSALLKELKKSLGCGGQIEEGKIVLHGEIADRASEWFVKMGARAVKV